MLYVIIKTAEGDVRFGQVGRERQSPINQILNFYQRRIIIGMSRYKPVAQDAALGEARGGQGKSRIAIQRLLIKNGCAIERLGFERVFRFPLFVFALQKEIVSLRIFCRSCCESIRLSRERVSPARRPPLPVKLRFLRQRHL